MSVVVDLSGLEAMLKRQRQRQALYARRCALSMRRFVPLREGTLRGSEPLNSNYEAGALTWSTPYAAKHYYVPMAHTTAGTTDHWDEAAWAADGEKLKAYAEKLYED